MRKLNPGEKSRQVHSPSAALIAAINCSVKTDIEGTDVMFLSGQISNWTGVLS